VLASPIDPFDPMDKAFQAVGASVPAGFRTPTAGWVLVRNYPLSGNCSPTSGAHPTTTTTWSHQSAPRRSPTHTAPDAVATPPPRSRPPPPPSAGTAVARAAFDRDDELPAGQHGFDSGAWAWSGCDPVRPGVADAVAECARAGIHTVAIAGDYPGTALAIARDTACTTPRASSPAPTSTP
jgi:Ca2+-transporting ATPase